MRSSYAEALSGMAFTQLVRPGAPVIFGTFSSSMSMQSGAPTFGTPEPQLVLNVIGSLARRLGVPFRSGGGLCASKLPDAQAAFEAANTLQHAMLAGVNFMLHVAGWLEGGLAMGYEKFVMDADQAQMMQVFLAGIDLSEKRPGARRHTGGRPREATSSAPRTPSRTSRPRSTARRIADNNSFEQWESEGGLDTARRANRIWKEMLAGYEAPPLDESVDEALRAFIAERKASQPDMSY